MKSILTAAVLSVSAISFVGCASKHESDVTSTIRTQSAVVAADTVVTTDAAKSVLEDRELKNVVASSTKVDGTATGKTADGTEVKVTVSKKTAAVSDVSVTVGLLGSPTLGAEIAKAIKVKAEGGTPTMP